MGWRSGENIRFPPMWPGFDSQTRHHMWVELKGRDTLSDKSQRHVSATSCSMCTTCACKTSRYNTTPVRRTRSDLIFNISIALFTIKDQKRSTKKKVT